MKTVTNLQEAFDLQDHPDHGYMWREVYGFMSACLAEAASLGDGEYVPNFQVAGADDCEEVILSDPEETALIAVECYGTTENILRFVFTDRVVFTTAT
jgi:hypothetical protein